MSEETESLEVSHKGVHAVPIGRALLVILGAVAFSLAFYEGIYPLLLWLTDRMALTAYTEKEMAIRASRVAGGLVGFIVGAGAGNLLTIYLRNLRDRWDALSSGGKVTVFLGVFLGLIASVPFLFFMNALLAGQYAVLLTAMTVLILGFSTLSVYVLRSIDDILPWNRGQIRSRRRGIKILDTNVIIDGRIVDVARTGFLDGPLYVPGFVLDELQYIADSSDPLRRQRGRRGLDVLRILQADLQLEVRTQDRLAPEMNDGVDSRLVRLARAMGGDIVTNDFNLNRVAALQEVKVLNLNDLALSLRPNVLPSETLEITVIREGNQPGQGVGYLDDGTMIVVENGRAHLGETLHVTVTQVIQTERGKMIFAHIDGDEGEHGPRRRPPLPRRP